MTVDHHRPRQKYFYRALFFANRFGIPLVIWLALMACSGGNQIEPKPQMAVPVKVASVMRKNVPVQLRAIGTVEAYSVISAKSQVGGELIKVYFQEGQDVKKGDLLFTIDPRPFETALKQAEANLVRDRAQVRQAEASLAKDRAQVNQAQANLARDLAQARYAAEDAQRYSYLVEKEYVAREQYDQIRTNAEALEATVRADKAAVDTAQAAVQVSQAALENAQAVVQASEAAVENNKIQLAYSSIRSPMNGRTGAIYFQQGNIVKANDLPLVVINQIVPIYVSFSVPEQNLADIKRYGGAAKLKVTVILPNEEKRPEEGILTFVDNTVDNTTGMIRLKATFANKDKRLWPGQFVNVLLTLTTQTDAVVVPSQAVQTGQDGLYAFVVKPDFTVEIRPLAAQRTTDGETVIVTGLTPGETVVTEGQLRLVAGAKVEVKKESGQGEKPR
jgi:multidrug efflux system membrane fusion protein